MKQATKQLVASYTDRSTPAKLNAVKSKCYDLRRVFKRKKNWRNLAVVEELIRQINDKQLEREAQMIAFRRSLSEIQTAV